jgi:hypothetical protein
MSKAESFSRNVILSVAFRFLRKMHKAKDLINELRFNWRDSSSRKNEIQNDGFVCGGACHDDSQEPSKVYILTIERI